jgi:hypothetical protein
MSQLMTTTMRPHQPPFGEIKMKGPTPQSSDGLTLIRTSPEFSLFAGGPFFRLLCWMGLSDDKLRRSPRAVVILPLLAWLPLFALSAVAGQLYAGSVPIAFLPDLEVHVRFLLALPLLMIAEIAVQQRIQPLLQEFLERKLIPEHAFSQFETVTKSTFRLRNSMLAEVLVLVFVYGIGILVIWRNFVALDTTAWYAKPSPSGSTLTYAGLWYGYVSLPIFQFLLCRWYFRLFVWSRFLWQVSRIKLSLVPTHPDRLGGLSFVSHAINSLAVLAAAHGALLAGYLSTRVLMLGTPLTQFKGEIAIMVIFVLCVTLCPLLVFVPQLYQAKRTGRREYGTLAAQYVRDFDAKWLRSGAVDREHFIGNSDIQSLADLANSYDVVQTMRATPITKEAVLLIAVATLVPIVPLLLTMMPLEELLKKLIEVLLK